MKSTPTLSLETQLLTAKQVAWVLNMSLRTLEKIIKEKEIAYFQYGGLRRFFVAAVLDFIRRRTVLATPAPAGEVPNSTPLFSDEAAWAAQSMERLVKLNVESAVERVRAGLATRKGGQMPLQLQA